MVLYSWFNYLAIDVDMYMYKLILHLKLCRYLLILVWCISNKKCSYDNVLSKLKVSFKFSIKFYSYETIIFQSLAGARRSWLQSDMVMVCVRNYRVHSKSARHKADWLFYLAVYFYFLHKNELTFNPLSPFRTCIQCITLHWIYVKIVIVIVITIIIINNYIYCMYYL